MKPVLHVDGRQRGWILVDALIALLIIVTGLTTLMSALSQAEKNTVANRNYNNALYIAQAKLEDLKQYDGTPTIKSLPDNIIDPISIQMDGVDFKAKITLLTVSEPLTRFYPYQVSVTWRDDINNVASPVQVAAYYYSN